MNYKWSYGVTCINTAAEKSSSCNASSAVIKRENDKGRLMLQAITHEHGKTTNRYRPQPRFIGLLTRGGTK